MWKSRSIVAISLVSGVIGCGRSGTSVESQPPTAAIAAPAAPSTTEPRLTAEHPHRPGVHGGTIVAIGRDSYHAEVVFERGGVVRLLMLGPDETQILEVDGQELTAFVKPDGASDSTSIEFRPVPQMGDTSGKTSQFVGQLLPELSGKPLELIIPIVRIGTERFRIGFASPSAAHAADAMPEKVVDAEELKLYLEPAGLYTQADIEANGRLTASQRFKGFMSKHDMHPKAGDKICPVTMTKANPECSWIINGMTYDFCCPPCVDEFVKLAKESPERLKSPSEYIKR